MTEGAEQACCVCGIPLPNRYAKAGRCEEPGCEALFCDLHWRRGNRRCPAHGWRSTEEAEFSRSGGSFRRAGRDVGRLFRWTAAALHRWNQSRLKAKKDGKNMTGKKNKIDVGAALNWMKARIWKDPEALRREVEVKIAENGAKLAAMIRDEAAAYEAVCRKKPEYDKAPPARKVPLKAEMERLIARHRNCKDQLEILQQNDVVLHNAVAALGKAEAYGGRIAVGDVDRIIDMVENAAENADMSGLASEDLINAGKPGVKVGTGIDVDEELGEYGEPSAAPESEPGADYESIPPEAAPESKSKSAESE